MGVAMQLIVFCVVSKVLLLYVVARVFCVVSRLLLCDCWYVLCGRQGVAKQLLECYVVARVLLCSG